LIYIFARGFAIPRLAFLFFTPFLASLVTYISDEDRRGGARSLPTAARRSKPRLPTTDGSNNDNGNNEQRVPARRTAPRRETRHNGRNKWRSFIPAVVIIKW
jgi:hypothetical protein